jgi:hypothetical protein
MTAVGGASWQDQKAKIRPSSLVTSDESPAPCLVPQRNSSTVAQLRERRCSVCAPRAAERVDFKEDCKAATARDCAGDPLPRHPVILGILRAFILVLGIALVHTLP